MNKTALHYPGWNRDLPTADGYYFAVGVDGYQGCFSVAPCIVWIHDFNGRRVLQTFGDSSKDGLFDSLENWKDRLLWSKCIEPPPAPMRA